MHWAEQWTRRSSSSCSPPAFGCQCRRPRGVPLDEIRITSSTSCCLLSSSGSLLEPLQQTASLEVSSVWPLGTVCTGDFQDSRAHHGCTAQKLQRVPSRSALRCVGLAVEIGGKYFELANMSFGLLHASKPSGLGACRLKFQAPARRKSTRGLHCKANQGRNFATSATALCVESPVSEAKVAVSVESSFVDDSTLGAPGLDDEAASIKAKPKRTVKTSRRKVPSRSTATQASEVLPEIAGSISPDTSDNLKLAALQVSPKVKVARVSRKKVPVLTGKSRSRSASVAKDEELSSSEAIVTATEVAQPASVSSSEVPPSTEESKERVAIQADTLLIASSQADEVHILRSHPEAPSSSDGDGENTDQEEADSGYVELERAKDKGLLGVFLNTASPLGGYVSEDDDSDKGSDVVTAADEGDSLPQQKVSTNLRQSSLDWVRSTSAPIPRNLPMKVSKWRRSVGTTSPVLGTIVPQRSVTAQEVIELLEEAKSFEDVVKTMVAYTGRVTSLEVKQILEDLGSKKDWLTASQLFDWLLDQPAYKPDESMYKTMINVLAKARRMDKVELIFECMEEDGMQPGLPEFSALIQGYLKSGTVYRAVTAFERMREDGMQPEVSLYNALLDGCARIPKGWETAVSLYETMKQDKVVPDRATYTSMLLLACRKGRYNSTIDFFKTMMASGYPPDKSVYHAVLNSYAKLGDTRMMLEVFEQLSDQKMEYDVMTYNVVLNALGRVGEIGRVSELYRRMRKAGVAADLQTCSILVTGFGKVQEWEEIDLVLEEMQNSGLQPDLTVYNSLISVYGKAGRLDAVEQIVTAMLSASDDQGSKISFDLITYNTLVDVYGKAGRLDDVKYWFSEMKREGFPPDVKTFNALLNAYGKAGLFDGVREVLRLFREHGRKPDLTFYNTLLFTFGRAGKYEDAWQIVADMEQAGCFPGVEIFNSLMFVFGRGSQYQAMKVYDYMVDAGISPNPTTFKLLIDIHGKRGMVDECLTLYAESLRILGKQVNESLLSSVFGACCNMRRIEDAHKLLEDLHTKQNVALACHNWLILGYGRKGLWRKSEQVLQETMPAKKLLPNGQTYSFLLEAYSLCAQFDKAAAVVEKMMSENLLSGIGGYNSVLRYYVRAKRYREALDLHDSLVNGQGPHPNHTSYAVLIESFGSDADVNKRLMRALRAIVVDFSPKVVVYSALLQCLGRCSRSGDAVSIFGALKMFGFPVALGELLLLDDVDEHDQQWQRLAEELQRLDTEGLNAEMQRGFHNAFVDGLWVLGWEVRALRVVELSLERGIFGQVCTWDDGEWRLLLQLTSVGPAQVLLLTWIAQIQAEVQKGVRIADNIRIVLAAEWQVLVQDNLDARQAVVAQLRDLKAPFANLHQDTCEFVASGSDFLEWLSQARAADSLFLSNSAANDPQMEQLRKQALQCFHA